jgi:TP901 family phage tail tape measure protein
MAQSYNRQINLYVNIDGKQVVNNAASIRAEMNKIVNAQARMTIGSQEYVLAAQKIKQLKGILDQHRADIASVDKSWSFAKMGDSFNRYTSMIMAGMASLAGLVFSVRTVIKSFEDFEARMANLSAITGLAGDDLTWLGAKAKELSTTTLEGGIRITKSATDIVDAFEKMGSARPDLLKNKEDLVEVTKAALILAEGSKLETLPAIEAVAAAMNQFGLGASEATRIINTMGAGSLAGSSEVDDLTKSLSTVGTVAANSNMTLEDTVGTLETLAERQLKGEEAGTQLKTTLISLKAAGLGYTSGIFNMRDALVELKAKIDAKSTALEKDTVLIDVFGKRNITVGTILSTSIERFDHFTKAVTGTNVAFEQAAINTDTHAAKLAQASNRLNLMSIELGEKLTPALTVSTSGLSYFIKAMSVTIDFVARNKAMLTTLIISLVAYSVAAKVVYILENGLNRERGIGLAITKLSIVWNRAASSAMLLYQAAVALLTGNLARATRAMQLFWAFSGLGAVALITAAIAGLGAALYMMSGQLTAAQKAQKVMNDVNLEAQKNIVDEKLKLEMLLNTAKNDRLSKEERLKAIKQLNELSPTYLGNLTLESIHTQKATDSIKDYTDSLFKMAQTQSAIEKIKEIDKQLIELQTNGADITTWQAFWHAFILGEKTTAERQKIISDNTKIQEDELYAQRKKVYALVTNQSEASTDYSEKETGAMYKFMTALKSVGDFVKNNPIKYIIPGGPPKPPVDNKHEPDLIAGYEAELKVVKERIAATPKEVAARNQEAEAIQNKINKLNELGTTKEGETGEKADEAAIKKRITQAEAAHNDEMARINREHLEGKSSDDQYKADLLSEDLKFLAKKMTIYKKGSKEYEAAKNESLTKQVEAEKTVHELLLKAQKELADAGIENLEDGIAKEKALEENRWADELAGLKKQLNDKKDLSAEEAALNDSINLIIEEKQKAHLKKMADLDQATAQKKIMDAAIIEQAKSQTDADKFLAERDMARASYKQELIDAKGDHAKIATAERTLSDKLVQIKQDELDKRKEIGDAVFGAANSLFGGLSELVGKETALGKALFLFQQAAAIGQIIFDMSIANMKAIAASPLTAGMPWVAINTAIGVGSIASVVAQTIAGFSEGGYTGSGDKNQPAGMVHKGEWVANAKLLNNPLTGPIIARLESFQRTGYIPTQGAVAASGENEYIASPKSPPQGGDFKNPSMGDNGMIRDPELTAAINTMSHVAALLMKNGVQFPIVPFKKQLDEVSDLINQTGMGGFKK